MQHNPAIKQAAASLKDADALLITAGAGMGVDSGLPDFRGNEGFWKAYPPIARRGISFMEMANPVWFQNDPQLAWAFYGHRLNLYRATEPHAGFHQLLRIGQKMPHGYFVFTSNVDGQFQKAGFDEDHIEECHGSIHHFQCTSPCDDNLWNATREEIIVDEESFQAQFPLPLCKYCGGLARPNILMFGDWSWISKRSNQQQNRLNAWLDDLKTSLAKLVIIELGAGKAVATVRHTSEQIARYMNATLVRINPRDSETPNGHISIPLSAAEGISALSEKIQAD